MVCENCRNDDMECEFCKEGIPFIDPNVEKAMADEAKRKLEDDAKNFVDALMDPNCDFVTVIEQIPNYSNDKRMDDFREEAIDYFKKQD